MSPKGKQKRHALPGEIFHPTKSSLGQQDSKVPMRVVFMWLTRQAG